MINKGSKDGIRVDNNVIAGKGLVGIVTEVGSNWATVRSIIDDSSNVSAMTVGTDDNCVVEGDLELIDEGKLRFTQLYDKEDKVTVGEQVVTSNISEKIRRRSVYRICQRYSIRYQQSDKIRNNRLHL